MSKKWRWAAGALGAVALGEAALIHLGRTYGSTEEERSKALPGDDIVSDPKVATDHAITIGAPPSAVWPWLVQMGWGRAGWYTARWVDRLLFPANGPSADRIIPELQDIRVGTFIPDGPPHTECGLIVEEIDRERALVMRSNSHLPMSWRVHATLAWSWAFVLTPFDDGRRTRFHFRSGGRRRDARGSVMYRSRTTARSPAHLDHHAEVPLRGDDGGRWLTGSASRRCRRTAATRA